MSIEINSLVHNHVRGQENPLTGQKGDGSALSNDKQAPTNTGEKVEFTETAQTLQSLEEEIKSLPEIDYDRVAAIKNDLKNGVHKIDPDQLAKNIIEFETDLVS